MTAIYKVGQRVRVRDVVWCPPDHRIGVVAEITKGSSMMHYRVERRSDAVRLWWTEHEIEAVVQDCEA